MAGSAKTRSGLVAPHGAVFPAAFPQLVDDLHVFVGDVVAPVVVGLRRQPHAAGRAVEIAGDDVPADAAAGQVVERRHAAGEQIGRLVGQVGGDAEAEMLVTAAMAGTSIIGSLTGIWTASTIDGAGPSL